MEESLKKSYIDGIIFFVKAKGVKTEDGRFVIHFNTPCFNEITGVYVTSNDECYIQKGEIYENAKEVDDTILTELGGYNGILDKETVRQAKDREFKPLQVGDNIAYLYRWSKTSIDLAKAKIIRFENNRQPWAVILEYGKEKKKLTSSCLKCY